MTALGELGALIKSLALSQGFEGQVIVACAALHLPAWIGVAIHPLSRRTPILATVAGLSTIGTLGGGLSLVVASRHGVLRAAGLRPAPETDWFWLLYAASLGRGETGLLLVAWGLLVIAAFGSIAAVRAALSSPGGRAPSAGTTSLLVFAWGLGGLLLARTLQVAELFAASPRSSSAFIEGPASLFARSTGIMAVTAVIAATLSGLAVWASRSRSDGPTRREKANALGLFAAGLVAFALTRPHAHDARAPIPFEEHTSTPWDRPDAGALPEIAGCMEMTSSDEGPGIDLRLMNADGRLRSGPPDTMVTALRSRREGHRQIPSSRPIPPLSLAAAPDMPVSAGKAYLDMVREVWPEGAAIVAISPRQTWMSRALGPIPRTRRTCTLRVHWGPGGRSLSSYATWQDAASAVAASPGERWSP